MAFGSSHGDGVSDSQPASLISLSRRLGLDWAQMHDLPMQGDLAHLDAPGFRKDVTPLIRTPGGLRT